MENFVEMVKKSKRMVFFGGAGVSTESGIPDFRSVDGLYHQSYADPPETILSHHYFMEKTAAFFQFYREKMIVRGAEPNVTHKVLAGLEEKGMLLAVVTQNIDGLHQAAGSRRVYELHGSIHRNYCMDCGKFYGLEAVENSVDIPRCTCGGVIKPDVVLYEEGLDQDVLSGAVAAISAADLLVVGGTSLSVYPAAGLIRYFKGNRLVLINKTATAYDRSADVVYNTALGEMFRPVGEEILCQSF